MNILGISGSLRRDSTNTKLLQAAQSLASPYFSLEIANQIESLPLFSPDSEADDVPAVASWAAAIKSAEGLIISTPEYARGYPGALKNALDWLVQGDSFARKPFLFLIASDRAEQSHQTLTTVLETMSGIHASQLDTVIPLLGTNLSVNEIVSNPVWKSSLEVVLRDYRSYIEALPALV